MSKTKLGALSLTAILSTFAMLTSPAGAAIKFEWKVKGEKLAAGESREFTTTNRRPRLRRTNQELCFI